jgi:predicted ester cyclase
VEGTSVELTYRRYLRALNERRFGDLEEFVHDELTYNGGGLTRDVYVAQRREEARQIPDLHYAVDMLLVGGDHVACRIVFDCTPQGEFLGIDVDGRRVSFVEHVFYRFRDGRIEDVWSVIDTDAIREQLAADQA